MSKGIVIIWPSHNDFKSNISNELDNYDINVIETNEMIVKNIFIKNILLEIHYGKTWWDENIENEYKKRIDNTKDTQILQYFIIENKELYLKIKSFKKNTREKFKIDKSYFHMSDPDCLEHLGLNCNCNCNIESFNIETIKHLNLLKNKNSIHFLNNANYIKENKFYFYFKKYNELFKKHSLFKKLDTDSFCIDNGGILAAYGLRDTHDIDFLNTYFDSIKSNDNDICCENKNHKREYEILGYSINDIINNEENHFYHFGMKFMSLEILKKFKFNRTHTIGTGHNHIRQKDINDYELIRNLY